MFTSLFCCVLLMVVAINGEAIQDDVGLLVAGETGVWLYNTSDIANPKQLTTYRVLYPDYHWKKNLLFTFRESKMMKSTLSGSVTTPPTVINNSNPSHQGLAVDWEQDRIYWVDADDEYHEIIKSIDLNGMNDSVVFVHPDIFTYIRSLQVDPYKRVLFWVAGFDHIQSCTLSGQEYRTLSTDRVSEFTLDLTAQRVYYMQRSLDLYDLYDLYSINYQGSDVRKYFTQSTMPWGMGLFKGNLHWSVYKSTFDDSTKNSYFATFNINNNATVMRKFSDKFFRQRKVVHPDLQRPPQELNSVF